MDFLLHNFIADLRGPQFLAFYFAVVIAAVAWARWRGKTLDPTRVLPVPPLPTEFDPLEIAYLRGGLEEQVRLVILDLIARKYLRHTTTKAKKGQPTSLLEQEEKHPPLKYLEPLPRAVFDALADAKSARTIFPSVPKALQKRGFGDNYAAALADRGLLLSEDVRRQILKAANPAQWLCLGLAIYKALVAFAHGHTNVIFLIIMAVIAMVILDKLGKRKRLSDLGERYLARLQQGLAGLKDRLPALAETTGDPHFVLAVATFGIATLATTSYDYYPQMFRKAALQNASGSGSVSSCGSSCSTGGGSSSSSDGGSSCSSGSSCGSSCGGGCGGGCGGCGS